MVENLPPDSATARATRGHNWLDEHYMVADLIDVLRQLAAWQVAAHSKDGQYRQPPPYFRPEHRADEEAKQAKRERAAEQAIAYLDHYRAQRAAEGG